MKCTLSTPLQDVLKYIDEFAHKSVIFACKGRFEHKGVFGY